MNSSEEERTDEELIIDSLIIEGKHGLYEDLDFIPTRQSLYNSDKVIPEYDEEIFEQIRWCRPTDVDENPVYFDQTNTCTKAEIGTLPDDIFIGALAAISVYSKYDLIENIFASKPEDFLKYGVFTCRFYVNGEWVEVITDTNIPCKMTGKSGQMKPAYGRSLLQNEMWISLVEKAFAKAMGSYEAISTLKVQKALLHLTGGSVQQCGLKEEILKYDGFSDQHAWKEFRHRISQDGFVLLMPDERKVGGEEEADESKAIVDSSYFIPNRLYSVIACRQVAGNELVLMHNPWNSQEYKWTGDWSDDANDWDLYPEVLNTIENDSSIPWRRRKPNGYFWIPFRLMVRFFSKMFTCMIFPNEKYSFYCAKGECRGKQCGGPLETIRDKDIVLKDAAQSRLAAIQKATAAVVVDGDGSWFNNPQFRIHVTQPTTAYVSVIPLGNGDEGDVDQAQVNVTVTSMVKQTAVKVPIHLWEVSQFEIVSSDKEAGTVAIKGQETSVWGILLDPGHYYHIVVNTPRKTREGDFILRVFTNRQINLETLPPIKVISESGEWKKVGDLDSTGGPPFSVTTGEEGTKENSKWCQNPQFHIQVADTFGKDDIYLKVVVRRFDQKGKPNKASADDKKNVSNVGLVVCKADVYEENAIKGRKKQPRMNKLGEPVPPKESSLKRSGLDQNDFQSSQKSSIPPKTILRKLSLEGPIYNLTTEFANKNESCIFFPKMPRSWAPNGLIVVPCLSEKGTKAHFEFEVYASESVIVQQLPETYSRSLSGDWNETNAGGCHLNPLSWKKNPKFIMRINNPGNIDGQARVRITLAKYGNNWKNLSKKDVVGCMIGFYLFVSQGTEQTQIYESTFVPGDEFNTDPSFTLPMLNHGQHYIIMPTTFGEGKIGSFVLSVLSEYECHIVKEK